MSLPKLVLLLAAAPFALAAPADAQTHSMQGMSMPGMQMPGMTMPAKKAATKKASKKPAARAKRKRAGAKPGTNPRRAGTGPASHKRARPHPHHGMPSMPGMTRGAKMPARDDMSSMFGMPGGTGSHSGHDMANMPGMAGGTQPQDGHDMAKMPGMPAGHDVSSMPGMARTGPANQSQPHPPAGHDMSNMPGMEMRATSAPAGHDMSSMPGMAMPGQTGTTPAGHNMAGMGEQAQSGTNLPAGSAPPPPIPTDHAADLVYAPQDMAMGRHHLQSMHGNQQFYQVMINFADYRVRRGRDGYAWDAEAWYGGDINRLWLKTEGEGEFRGGVESAEMQALYSHAIGPYFNLQGGLRYDVRPGPSRAYAALGVEGLAPSFFETEAFLFVSQKGDFLARAGAWYDQRITQRLILQPRAEINFSAQNVPESRIGSGLSELDLGLRLRYDIRREFSPYVGVVYDRTFGNSARFRRAVGESAGGWNFVMGVRAWF